MTAYRALRRSVARNLELFSDYSAFMLTDDELLAIHGGATNSGSGSHPSGGSSSDTSSAAPPAAPPPPPPQAPPAPSNLSPASVTGTVTLDLTPVVTEAGHRAMESGSADAFDTLVTHAIQAVDNFFFGPASPPPSAGGDGGAGGSHGAGGSGGSGG